jgi:excinuclease ABC subunit B
VKGRVILYADEMTGSMTHAIEETNRRRGIQLAYNKEHGITPKTIQKNIKDITETLQAERERAVGLLMAVDTERANDPKELKKLIAERREAMEEAVKLLDFETAALIRDEVYKLEEKLPPPPKKPRKPGRVYLDE